MKRVFYLLVLAFLSTSVSIAQTAVVKRDVNLRSDPSTASDIIEGLKAGAELQLKESDQTNGFYHVTAGDGRDGWVWRGSIKILTETPTPAPSASQPGTATPAAPPSGDLFS